jgi:prepilin-type N-terminal cleavage/methylation domain-containing protein
MFQRYREIQERRAAVGGDEVGFTLIELLIVIVVLGILAAVVVFALVGVGGTSVQAACNSDAKTVDTAVAAWQAQNSGTLLVINGGNTAATNGGQSQLVPTYLKSWPSGNLGHYVISYTGGSAGQVQVGQGVAATPSATGTTPTNYDSQVAAVTASAGPPVVTAVTATGCFAIS